MTIKKVFLLVVCACVCIVCSTYAADISVSVNGKPLICDASPVIRNDRVLVPMRTVFEALGCDVSYNEEFDGAYVYASKDKELIVHKIGSDSIFVNGDTVPMDVSSEIISGRTLVPLRAVSEALGCDVSWNPEEYSVSVEYIKSDFFAKNT